MDGQPGPGRVGLRRCTLGGDARHTSPLPRPQRVVRVLLIEDDSLAADVLEALLARMGHEVERAEDGMRGVERFRAGRFRVVVCDLLMPGKSGLETIGEIRRLDPAVRVIAISGGSPIQPAQGALSAAPCVGADATLTKPFAGAELEATISRLLSPVSGGGSGE